MPIPLSSRTEQVAAALFEEPELGHIIRRLLQEASENIPFQENSTPEEMERIRYAIMKLIVQNRKNENRAFEYVKTDWRDLFMAAGFGYCAEEHNRWADRIMAGKKL